MKLEQHVVGDLVAEGSEQIRLQGYVAVDDQEMIGIDANNGRKRQEVCDRNDDNGETIEGGREMLVGIVGILLFDGNYYLFGLVVRGLGSQHEGVEVEVAPCC